MINPKLNKSKELKHFTPNGSSMTLEELDNLVRICLPDGLLWMWGAGLSDGRTDARRTPCNRKVIAMGPVNPKGDP